MAHQDEQLEPFQGEAFLDLEDGRVISRGGPGWVHQIVAHAMSVAVREPGERLSAQLLQLLDDDNNRAAAALVASSIEAGAAATPNALLLVQLRRIETSSLPESDAAAFLRARCILATVGNDYGLAGADAQALLDNPHVVATDRTWLRLTVATAGLRRGAIESSFAVFREIAESDSNDAESRAWAYRNMSVIVPFNDERCEQYSRRSADFFLICGNKLQAAASLVRAMRARLDHKPLAAAELLDEPIEWFSGEGLHDRYIRGGMLQNRARAAWVLKRYDRACYRAARPAGLRGAARRHVDVRVRRREQDRCTSRRPHRRARSSCESEPW